jgi:prolyl oligopeptidase
VKFSGISWTKDSKGFFYSRFDAPEEIKGSTEDGQAGTETKKLAGQKVYYHRVGTKQADDVLIHEDPSEPDWMFSVQVTHDGEYLLMSTRKDCDDLELLSFAKVGECGGFHDKVKFTPLISEWIGGFTYIHNTGSTFYFITNFEAPRKKVIAINLDSPAQKDWL